jgi:predicted cupin superfamily sugar epimerase
MSILAAADIVARLRLAPHPEGGWYRETFRDMAGADGRPLSTAILFLLAAGERSHWHRIDASEIWLWHVGSPLALDLSPDGRDTERRILGANLAAAQTPQIVVPARCWQAAASLGDWTLVSCTVAPGFDFDAFELAPPGWRPTRDPMR